MLRVSVEAAEARLEELVVRAWAGESVVITRDGIPVVQLEPVRNRSDRGDFEEGVALRPYGNPPPPMAP